MSDKPMTMQEVSAEYERTGTPAPSWLREQIAISHGTPAPGDDVPPFVFCGYGTSAQADAFRAFCEQHGVTRRIVVPTDGRQYKLSRR